ncbi:hypothetical protein BV898_10196 [Hypsibius exemplaris]|uniref:Uncharacterized protein n=1 Tax=Hypsibius exemplaris TaxID=2072580 RepID=A0A1W0WKA7_HYPEX|nr:hypothetical protein BV898_10196 [Hypsibius exemplaris]
MKLAETFKISLTAIWKLTTKKGHSISEIVSIFKAPSEKSTIYIVAKEFAVGVKEKLKKQKHPWKKIDPPSLPRPINEASLTAIRKLMTKKGHSISEIVSHLHLGRVEPEVSSDSWCLTAGLCGIAL